MMHAPPLTAYRGRLIIPALPEPEAAMTISEVGERRLTAMRKAGSPETTVREYGIIHRQFMAFVQQRLDLADDLRHVTAETCAAFRDYLAEMDVKPNTIRHKLSTLSGLAKFAMLQRDARQRPLLAENPLLQIEWPKRQRTRKEFLHPEELRAFLAIERPVYESVVRDLLLDTGLRVSELCRVNVEHFVKLADGWVIYTVVKGEGRQDELVPIPVSTPVALGIVAYLDARPATMTRLAKGKQPLLTNSLGARWTRFALLNVIQRMAKAAGITRIKVSPHRLRRTSNVVARYGGLDSHTRSALLNHLSPRTIAEYDAVIPGELSKAREQARTEGLRRYLGEGL